MRKIAIACAFFFVFVGLVGCGQTSSSDSKIANFEECAKAGNPIMESYPRQCRAEDKTFVEELSEEESELLGKSGDIEITEEEFNLENNQEKNMKEISFVDQYSGAVLKTNKGDITVEFYGDVSPKTVNNFLKLASEEFYNGTRFHRVIKDFMIQGGDPLSKEEVNRHLHGTGDPGYKFEDEFNNKPIVRGSLAMANSGPNTNGSQFFIVTAEATPWLDGKHTNFGHVVDGMDVIDLIEEVEKDARDNPVDPVIVKIIELIAK